MNPFDAELRVSLPGEISAENIGDFTSQLAEVLKAAREPRGVVYVWNSKSPIPRLRGSSPVLYIGKTRQSLFDRYTKRSIRIDSETYWNRYVHIFSEYGPITIDVYPAENPEKLENDFLFVYHKQFLEAPPLNTTNFRMSLLSDKQRQILGSVTG